MTDRMERKGQILAYVEKVLDGLQEEEFARLSGKGHEVWLQSEIDRAVYKVAGRKTEPQSGIRG